MKSRVVKTLGFKDSTILIDSTRKYERSDINDIIIKNRILKNGMAPLWIKIHKTRVIFENKWMQYLNDKSIILNNYWVIKLSE